MKRRASCMPREFARGVMQPPRSRGWRRCSPATRADRAGRSQARLWGGAASVAGKASQGEESAGLRAAAPKSWPHSRLRARLELDRTMSLQLAPLPAEQRKELVAAQNRRWRIC